jgi:hypothetical protein
MESEDERTEHNFCADLKPFQVKGWRSYRLDPEIRLSVLHSAYSSDVRHFYSFLQVRIAAASRTGSTIPGNDLQAHHASYSHEPTTDDPKHYCTFKVCRFFFFVYPSLCQTTLFQLERFLIEKALLVTPPNTIDLITLPVTSTLKHTPSLWL